jgi:hypothetical protein
LESLSKPMLTFIGGIIVAVSGGVWGGAEYLHGMQDKHSNDIARIEKETQEKYMTVADLNDSMQSGRRSNLRDLKIDVRDAIDDGADADDIQDLKDDLEWEMDNYCLDYPDDSRNCD